MFLNKLIVNLRDRQARSDLARPYELHRTLWRAFPDGKPGRIMFRVDADRYGRQPFLLVQSEFKPDWEKLPVGYLLEYAPPKPLDDGNLSFHRNQRLRFRLRANPTKRVAEKNQRLGPVMAGKRVGLVTERDQIGWLIRKADAGGFRIPGGWVEAKEPETGEPIRLPNFRVDVVTECRDRNGKPGHEKGEFVAVRFDGVLEVTDPERFRQTVYAGVGSAKGFGFGLLSAGPA